MTCINIKVYLNFWMIIKQMWTIRITKIINYIDGSNWLDTSTEESGHTNYMNQQNGIAILKEI